MKYVSQAKRVLRAKEIDKTDRFTLHEVRVAGKTCTSCKGREEKRREEKRREEKRRDD